MKAKQRTVGSGYYEIRIAGHLSHYRASEFEGMEVKLDADGETILLGPVADQAALHGILVRIRDLGVILISLNRLEIEDLNVEKVIKS